MIGGLKMAGERFNWMFKEMPAFGVQGSQVKVIYQPSEFYEELVSRSASCSRRIVLASLYVGTGNKEKALLNTIQGNLMDNKDVRVSVLLDWCRGTRISNHQSSSSLLAKLARSCVDQCRIAMYHTPHLRGLVKKLVPPRWNETIGLQHCKIYIFDDSVIISGANLSSDYFTNRQDRYVLIDNCQPLADFYETFIQKISKFSLQMDDHENFEKSSELSAHPYEGKLEDFTKESHAVINNFLEEQIEKNQLSETEKSKFDTWIFPSVQMGPLGIRQDSEITMKVLKSGEENGKFVFGSGYFNLTEEYLHEVLNGASNFDLLMAHPKANGFLGAGGPAGGIPAAYTHIAANFFNCVNHEGMQHRVSMHEYQREGWTFHAKGLWYYPPKSELPCLTMVGSPNYGYRSVDKDLETQITILTENRGLQEQLDAEQKQLFAHSDRLTAEEFSKTERSVPGWVKMVVGVARKYF